MGKAIIIIIIIRLYHSLIINLINKTAEVEAEAQESDKKGVPVLRPKGFQETDLREFLEAFYSFPIIHNSFAILVVCFSAFQTNPKQMTFVSFAKTKGARGICIFYALRAHSRIGAMSSAVLAAIQG